MIALGLDPGLQATGVAVLEAPQTVLYHGVLRVREGDVPTRLLMLTHTVVEIIQAYQPQVLAIERFSFQRRAVTTFEAMNWLIGALIVQAPGPVRLYTVSEWRAALLGRGWRARGKDAAQYALTLRLGVELKSRGLHDMDAAGLALVALDELSLEQRRGTLLPGHAVCPTPRNASIPSR